MASGSLILTLGYSEPAKIGYRSIIHQGSSTLTPGKLKLIKEKVQASEKKRITYVTVE